MIDRDVKRRTLLATGLAAVALSGSVPTPRAQGTQARRTFLLVHGAYHGGWCWHFVADKLESKGHKVYAPSLTGNADRSHLLTSAVNLDTQIADIVNLALWEDLKNICLVAHSFGGWPASGAVEKLQDRISSVVWVDAFKPKNGEKPVDYISDFSRKALEEAVARGEAGRPSAPPKTFSLAEKHYAWMESKLSQQPNGVAFQAINLSGKLDGVAKKTYIRAPKYPQAAFDKALAECRVGGWQTHVNETSGHDVMIDDPDWLTEIILKSV